MLLPWALLALTPGIQAASPASMLRKWLPWIVVKQATPSTSTVVCNNSPLLCSRPYSNITHMGAHDSPFLRDASTGNSIAGNQFYNATIALSAGLRLLQAQVHDSDGTLHLCHTLCELLDAGPLSDWLAKIKHWLDTHPNDVVTLLLVNSDNAPASSFGAAFETSGIAPYAFTPSSPNTTTTWPTLQELLTTNHRLVTFITPLPTASLPSSQKYPYLLPEFTHLFETPYNTTSLSSFTCALDRPSSSSTTTSATTALSSGLLPLLNHFVYIAITSDIMIPDVHDIGTTNGASLENQGALGRHVKECVAEWGDSSKPVFVLVDFWDRGEVMEVADRLNGVEGTVEGRVDDRGLARSAGVRGVPGLGLGGEAGEGGGAGRWLALGLFLGVALVLL